MKILAQLFIDQDKTPREGGKERNSIRADGEDFNSWWVPPVLCQEHLSLAPTALGPRLSRAGDPTKG